MNKVWSEIKYVGKNFWKVLPVGSEINHENNVEKLREEGKYEPFNLKNMANDAFHIFYGLAGGLLLTTYIGLGAIEGAWTPKEIKEYNKRVQIENISPFLKQNELEKSVK